MSHEVICLCLFIGLTLLCFLLMCVGRKREKREENLFLHEDGGVVKVMAVHLVHDYCLITALGPDNERVKVVGEWGEMDCLPLVGDIIEISPRPFRPAEYEYVSVIGANNE